MTRKLELAMSGFTDGLNTEASVLNVLPSEMMDGSINAELMLNGSARRRRGVDFIGASSSGGFLQTLRTGTSSEEAYQESPSCAYVRLTAPNGNLVDRLVVDLNNAFYIYELDDATTSLANIDTPAQIIDRGIQSNDSQTFYNMQFAQSGNKLFFAGLKTCPGYLKVSDDNVNLELTYFDVIIRDLTATSKNSRVKVGTAWYECSESHVSAADNQPGSGANWERYWFQLEGAVPSTIPDWVTATTYASTLVKKYNKRHEAVADDTYPTTVEFFAGRIWLGGDPKNPNTIYYSRVIVNDSDIERFMQFADPLDIDDPDVVDSDGGTIAIQGAGIARRLISLVSVIFIGCSNGVWQVNGSNGIFKSTDFTVKQALVDGVPGTESMVRVDKELVLFGDYGIWHANVNTDLTSSTAGSANFISLNENRFEQYYRNIPQTNKATARCVYNQAERRIYYFFNKERTAFENSYGALNQPGYTRNVIIIDSRFDKGLLESQMDQSPIRRTLKGALFLYELADNAHSAFPYIAAPFVLQNNNARNSTENVTVGGVLVTASSVTVTSTVQTSTQGSVMFLAMQRSVSGSTVTIKVAFGKLLGDTLQDWASDNSYVTSFTTRIITGVQTGGDILHRKAATYLFFIFQKVETGTLVDGVDTNPGGCFARTAWQWATTNVSAKYGPQQAVYFADRFNQSLADGGDDGHNHCWYKLRVRGTGNALQVIFENDGDKDFHLVGWTQQFYGKND